LFRQLFTQRNNGGCGEHLFSVGESVFTLVIHSRKCAKCAKNRRNINSFFALAGIAVVEGELDVF
jgi:hypothetical protein